MSWDEVSEAVPFFANQRKIHRILKTLGRVGWVTRLGQPATTLSGGGTTVKLATELPRARHTPTVYFLDEPTTGFQWRILTNDSGSLGIREKATHRHH
ncbi:MAG: hypothetical protein Ct9H90mP16_14620 [Candidatus Poseidoniales archaeon]|nr:MAG: hypothetical protein Ct9H90mP16_14620 [Candidatus Poseidoniales archaeon]